MPPKRRNRPKKKGAKSNTGNSSGTSGNNSPGLSPSPPPEQSAIEEIPEEETTSSKAPDLDDLEDKKTEDEAPATTEDKPKDEKSVEEPESSRKESKRKPSSPASEKKAEEKGLAEEPGPSQKESESKSTWSQKSTSPSSSKAESTSKTSNVPKLSIPTGTAEPPPASPPALTPGGHSIEQAREVRIPFSEDPFSSAGPRPSQLQNIQSSEKETAISPKTRAPAQAPLPKSLEATSKRPKSSGAEVPSLTAGSSPQTERPKSEGSETTKRRPNVSDPTAFTPSSGKFNPIVSPPPESNRRSGLFNRSRESMTLKSPTKGTTAASIGSPASQADDQSDTASINTSKSADSKSIKESIRGVIQSFSADKLKEGGGFSRAKSGLRRLAGRPGRIGLESPGTDEQSGAAGTPPPTSADPNVSFDDLIANPGEPTEPGQQEPASSLSREEGDSQFKDEDEGFDGFKEGEVLEVDDSGYLGSLLPRGLEAQSTEELATRRKQRREKIRKGKAPQRKETVEQEVKDQDEETDPIGEQIEIIYDSQDAALKTLPRQSGAGLAPQGFSEWQPTHAPKTPPNKQRSVKSDSSEEFPFNRNRQGYRGSAGSPSGLTFYSPPPPEFSPRYEIRPPSNPNASHFLAAPPPVPLFAVPVQASQVEAIMRASGPEIGKIPSYIPGSPENGSDDIIAEVLQGLAIKEKLAQMQTEQNLADPAIRDWDRYARANPDMECVKMAAPVLKIYDQDKAKALTKLLEKEYELKQARKRNDELNKLAQGIYGENFFTSDEAHELIRVANERIDQQDDLIRAEANELAQSQEDLSEKRSELRQTRQLARDTIKDTRMQFSSRESRLRSELKDADGKLQRCAKEKAKLKFQITEFLRVNGILQDDNWDLKEAARLAGDPDLNCKRKLAKARREIDRLEEEIKIQLQARQDNEKAIQTLYLHFESQDDLEAVINSNNSVIEELRTRLQRCETSYYELVAESDYGRAHKEVVQKLEEEIDRLKQALADCLKHNMGTLQDKKDEQDEDVENLKKALEDCNAEVTRLKREDGGKGIRLEQVTNELEQQLEDKKKKRMDSEDEMSSQNLQTMMLSVPPSTSALSGVRKDLLISETISAIEIEDLKKKLEAKTRALEHVEKTLKEPARAASQLKRMVEEAVGECDDVDITQPRRRSSAFPLPTPLSARGPPSARLPPTQEEEVGLSTLGQQYSYTLEFRHVALKIAFVHLVNCRAIHGFKDNDSEEVFSIAEKLQQSARDVKDQAWIALSLYWLGIVLYFSDHAAEALDCFKEASAIDELPDQERDWVDAWIDRADTHPVPRDATTYGGLFHVSRVNSLEMLKRAKKQKSKKKKPKKPPPPRRDDSNSDNSDYDSSKPGGGGGGAAGFSSRGGFGGPAKSAGPSAARYGAATGSPPTPRSRPSSRRGPQAADKGVPSSPGKTTSKGKHASLNQTKILSPSKVSKHGTAGGWLSGWNKDSASQLKILEKPNLGQSPGKESATSNSASSSLSQTVLSPGSFTSTPPKMHQSSSPKATRSPKTPKGRPPPVPGEKEAGNTSDSDVGIGPFSGEVKNVKFTWDPAFRDMPKFPRPGIAPGKRAFPPPSFPNRRTHITKLTEPTSDGKPPVLPGAIPPHLLDKDEPWAGPEIIYTKRKADWSTQPVAAWPGGNTPVGRTWQEMARLDQRALARSKGKGAGEVVPKGAFTGPFPPSPRLSKVPSLEYSSGSDLETDGLKGPLSLLQKLWGPWRISMVASAKRKAASPVSSEFDEDSEPENGASERQLPFRPNVRAIEEGEKSGYENAYDDILNAPSGDEEAIQAAVMKFQLAPESPTGAPPESPAAAKDRGILDRHDGTDEFLGDIKAVFVQQSPTKVSLPASPENTPHGSPSIVQPPGSQEDTLPAPKPSHLQKMASKPNDAGFYRPGSERSRKKALKFGSKEFEYLQAYRVRQREMYGEEDEGFKDGGGNDEVEEQEDEVAEKEDFRESPSDDPDLKMQGEGLGGLALIPEEP